MFRAFVYVRKIHEQQRWHRRNSCHHTYKSTSKWNVRITMTMLLYFREWWILWQRLQYATQCFYHVQRIVIELTTESCEVDNYSWQQGSMEPGISYAVLYFFYRWWMCLKAEIHFHLQHATYLVVFSLKLDNFYRCVICKSLSTTLNKWQMV